MAHPNPNTPPAELPRTKHTFTIPEKLRQTVDGQPLGAATVSMQLLKASDELYAAKVGGFNLTATQSEAVKRSICALDDKPVSGKDLTIDRFWENAHPKVRKLLAMAFDKIHGTSNEEDDGFFASQVVEIG